MNKTTKRIPTLLLVCCSLGLAAGCGKPGSGGAADSGPTAGSGPSSTGGTVKTIQDHIAADKEMAGADVKVKEEGGSISLEGTVNSVAQKDKAEQIVYAVQKEMKQQTGVLNNLTVKEGASPPGPDAGKDAGAAGNGGN